MLCDKHNIYQDGESEETATTENQGVFSFVAHSGIYGACIL